MYTHLLFLLSVFSPHQLFNVSSLISIALLLQISSILFTFLVIRCTMLHSLHRLYRIKPHQHERWQQTGNFRPQKAILFAHIFHFAFTVPSVWHKHLQHGVNWWGREKNHRFPKQLATFLYSIYSNIDRTDDFQFHLKWRVFCVLVSTFFLMCVCVTRIYPLRK